MSSGNIVEQRLDNGLLILLQENHIAPVVSFNIAYRVGSKHEQPGVTGVSHLLEHEMFKGTRDYPPGEFDRLLTFAGADNNAFTWMDQTVYYEIVATDKIELVLKLEADRMRNLLFDPAEHAEEMKVVLNELEQREDSPDSLLLEQVQSTAFAAHPYSTPSSGWLDDVRHLRLEDVRGYYDSYYHPDNAFIVAVGDFASAEMTATIAKYFAGLPPGNVVLPRLPQEPPQLGQRRLAVRRAGNSDYLLIGWKIPESTSFSSHIST